MFSSLEDFENSRAFWVFFVIAFPILFLTIWCFVLAITSRMSGWNKLAKLYPHTNQVVEKWIHRGGGGVRRIKLPYAGARGRLTVGTSKQGIAIKSPLLFRPFNPTLFLPFDKIASERDFSLLMFDFVGIKMEDAQEIEIGILKSARQMAEDTRHISSQT